MLGFITDPLRNAFSQISYSLKVKIVITFSSLLSVVAVISLLKLQEPFNNSINDQTKAAEFYSAWVEAAISLQVLSSDRTPENYKSFLSRLDIAKSKEKKLLTLDNEDFDINVKLNAWIANLSLFGDFAYLDAISNAQVQEHILKLDSDATSILTNNLNIPIGSDLPTYIVGCIIYHQLADKAPSDIAPFLLTALKIIPEDELPVPPGKLLDLANSWNNNKDSPDGLQQKFALLSDLSKLLLSLLNHQQATLQLRQWASIFFVFLGLIIVLTVYSTRGMRTPLADLRFAAQQIAHGNLTQRAVVDSSDEVAEMCSGFNSMASLLDRAVTTTSVVSHKLTETIRAITNSARLFDQNVYQQEQTITQIAKNTVGIIQTSKDVVEALEEALLVATDTQNFAINAQGDIRMMQDVLARTAVASQQIVLTLNLLTKKVYELNAIINTIVTVADEANLLSINTALISQSAHHRKSGFGVIAEKISELASQTAYVTLSIEDSVKAILSLLSKAGTQVHQLARQMHSHSEASSHLVEQFTKMKQTATEQCESCKMMQSAIEQQQKSAEQIRNTILLLSQGAKISTRSVRNLYSQVRYLAEASSNLQIIFERFHTHS